MAQLDPSELRPFGVGEAIDVAGTVFRSHFRSIVLRSAMLVVPLTALRWAHQMSDLHPVARALARMKSGQFEAVDFIGASRFMFTGVAEHQTILSLSLFFVTLVLGSAWCTRPALAAIAGAERLRPRNFNLENMSTNALRVVALAGFCVVGAMTIIGLLVGSFFLGRWCLLPGIAAGESPRHRVGARARALATGHEIRIGVRVFLGCALASLFVSAVGLVGMGLFAAGALNVPESLVTVSMVMSALSATFVCGYMGCLLAVVYLEQRTRNEGFDIALMIQEIPQRSVTA